MKYALPVLSAAAFGALLIGLGSVTADDRPYYGHGPHTHHPGWHMGQGPAAPWRGPGTMRPGYGYGNGMMAPGYGGAMMGPSSGRGMYGRGGVGAMAIDDNGDGVVSDAEAARHFESAFSIMDADEDGNLTEREFLSVRMGQGPGSQWRQPNADVRNQRKAARFKEMDGDADGNVSQSEFLAYGKKRFESADQDKNGTVTVWEFRARRHM